MLRPHRFFFPAVHDDPAVVAVHQNRTRERAGRRPTEIAQRLQTLGAWCQADADAGRGGGGGGRGRGGAGGPPSLSSVSGQLLLGSTAATQDGSALPPAQTVAVVNAILKQYEAVRAQAALLLR